MTKVFLALTVVLACFHVAGHLFDISANQPNWRSGEIDDVSRLRDFYAKASPTLFFVVVTIAAPLANLVTLIMVWDRGGPTTTYLAGSFAISLIVLIVTIAFFVPINQYLYAAGTYDADELRMQVGRWITGEYVRVVAIVVAAVLALMGANAYYEA